MILPKLSLWAEVPLLKLLSHWLFFMVFQGHNNHDATCKPKLWPVVLESVHAQLSLTLCNPTYCSPPGSCVNGTLQAKILEWIAMSSSRGSSRPGTEPRSPAFQADSLPFEPPAKPVVLGDSVLNWVSCLNTHHFCGYLELYCQPSIFAKRKQD